MEGAGQGGHAVAPPPAMVDLSRTQCSGHGSMEDSLCRCDTTPCLLALLSAARRALLLCVAAIVRGLGLNYGSLLSHVEQLFLLGVKSARL